MLEANRYKHGKLVKIYNILKLQKINNIVDKGLCVGFDIIEYFATAMQAFDHEIQLIKSYGRICDNSGILTNLTTGGDGLANTANPMYGKNHSEISKLQISKTRKQFIKEGLIIPTKHSEKHKQNLKPDNKGGKAVAKPIFKICSNSGMVLDTYSSCQQAAHAVNGLKTNIHSSATKYKHRLSYGFYWRFVDDNNVVNNILNNFEELKINQGRIRHIYVNQYDLNNKFIQKWNTATDAAKYYNLDISTLCKCVKTGKIYGGYLWYKTG